MPSSNVVIEPELSAAAPASTTVHFTRAWYRFDSADHNPKPLEPLPALAEDTVGAVSVLCDSGVQAIASGSTAGSFFAGADYEQNFIERMSVEANGVPIITPASAVSSALTALGATTVSIITPYLEPLYEAERAYFESRGFMVANSVGIGVAHGRDMAYIDPLELNYFVQSAFDRTADVCFISCTNLRTFDWIEQWERELGRPVVTSNQATLWTLLGLVDVDEPVTGLGQLLASVHRPRREPIEQRV